MAKFDNNNDFLDLFENKLSKFTGAKYVVLTDSCTSALFAVCKFYKVKKVNLPERTYVSVPQMLKNNNTGTELGTGGRRNNTTHITWGTWSTHGPRPRRKDQAERDPGRGTSGPQAQRQRQLARTQVATQRWSLLVGATT